MQLWVQAPVMLGRRGHWCGGGLLVGSAAGSNADQVSGREAQRRYDNASVECMYAHGNQVPGYGSQAAAAPPQPVAAPPSELYLDEALQFIYSPELDSYIAVGSPYDLVYTGGAYFYFYGGRWYRRPYYNGPWVLATGKGVPHPEYRDERR